MNADLSLGILEEARKKNICEFCVCPGARNSPLVALLLKETHSTCYFWFEERSAAFFALGRARLTGVPVAVVTTSGTAAAELLPAAMEAYYTGVPLLLITADRPRRFRGTGAPQTAEQVGLFGIYAPYAQDLAQEECCSLTEWTCCAPAHINVCFEEPLLQEKNSFGLATPFPKSTPKISCTQPKDNFLRYTNERGALDDFLQKSNYPLVVVSTLSFGVQDAVVNFLLKLHAPVFLEGISGLREESRLHHLRIARTEKIWQSAASAEYPIDGILRLGGVPTCRLWRDLEDREGEMHLCSISDSPFTGLSWGTLLHVQLSEFFNGYISKRRFTSAASERWLTADRLFCQKLQELFKEEPRAEASLLHELSCRLPAKARIYLGNSLPIREWDLAASREDRGLVVNASRGVNGIDGQVSTFIGLSLPEADNWAIVGDLTMLYDMAGPWILAQLQDVCVTLVVINNGGGKIFSRMFVQSEFQNLHDLHFEPLANLWNLRYERWREVPDHLGGNEKHNRLIELIPDNEATNRFWQKFALC